jgi:hypothetical protein
MKTPREILSEQHQAATPKLDTIRSKVVAGLNHQDTKTQSPAIYLVSWFLGSLNKIWLELVFPSRRVWAGLATAWLLIIAVNFSLRDPAPVGGQKISSPTPLMTFQQQERLLAELTGPDEWRVADRPKKFSPKPRTESAKLLMT